MEYRRQRYFEITDDLLASRGQRFINYLIDYVVQILLLLGLGFVLGLIAIVTNNQELVNSFEHLSRLQEYALGLGMVLLYYNIFEIFFARTVGKFITKTMVVTEDGEKPDSQTILTRTLCRCIPFDALSFLGSGRGWHDSISKTYVVNKDALKEKKDLFYSFDEIGKPQEEN